MSSTHHSNVAIISVIYRKAADDYVMSSFKLCYDQARGITSKDESF